MRRDYIYFQGRTYQIGYGLLLKVVFPDGEKELYCLDDEVKNQNGDLIRDGKIIITKPRGLMKVINVDYLSSYEIIEGDNK